VRSSAEGASIEAPQAQSGYRDWGGGAPFSVGAGSDGLLLGNFWLGVVDFGVYSDKNSSRGL